MSSKLLDHVRGNAVGYLALFVALGGTSYAAAGALQSNSVGSRQLKDSAVTSRKVADHSLLALDFKSGQLAAGREGPVAHQGRGASPD